MLGSPTPTSGNARLEGLIEPHFACLIYGCCFHAVDSSTLLDHYNYGVDSHVHLLRQAIAKNCMQQDGIASGDNGETICSAKKPMEDFKMSKTIHGDEDKESYSGSTHVDWAGLDFAGCEENTHAAMSILPSVSAPSVDLTPTSQESEESIDQAPSQSDRAFICSHEGCDKAFKRPFDHKRHQLKHQYPPYHCLAHGCPRKGKNGFYRRDKLESHQKNRHGLPVKEVSWGYSLPFQTEIHATPCLINGIPYNQRQAFSWGLEKQALGRVGEYRHPIYHCLMPGCHWKHVFGFLASWWLNEHQFETHKDLGSELPWGYHVPEASEIQIGEGEVPHWGSERALAIGRALDDSNGWWKGNYSQSNDSTPTQQSDSI